jgi:hypothetical protein
MCCVHAYVSQQYDFKFYFKKSEFGENIIIKQSKHFLQRKQNKKQTLGNGDPCLPDNKTSV